LQIPKSESDVPSTSHTSNISVDDASSEEVTLSATSESDEVSTISYPAPLPPFSPPIAQVLKDGNKTKVMLLYSDIIKEACAFYSAICPSQTGLAKQSLLNVGKTVTENFPVLSVADHPNPWTYFNDKLSSALRNTRCRLKRKLASPTAAVTTPKSLRIIQPVMQEVSEEVYKRHVGELKREAVKAKPDMNHMKFLLQQTHHNRRAWIDTKSSAELRLATVVDEYPCFRMPEMLLEEFRLFKGAAVVDNFAGLYAAPLYNG